MVSYVVIAVITAVLSFVNLFFWNLIQPAEIMQMINIGGELILLIVTAFASASFWKKWQKERRIQEKEAEKAAQTQAAGANYAVDADAEEEYDEEKPSKKPAIFFALTLISVVINFVILAVILFSAAGAI